MLIDDGVPNRGHRENLFNNDFRVCGIFSGEHKDFDTVTVIDYAASFVKAGDEDPIERQMDEFLKEEVRELEDERDKLQLDITRQKYKVADLVRDVRALRSPVA